MLVCSSEPALERCGDFLIRCVFFARASSTMPKSAKVRLSIALPPAHLKAEACSRAISSPIPIQILTALGLAL
jgi:hypothetical protein